MTPQEAREIILTEWECVDRQDTPKCDRDCRHCDLVMDTELVREAYRMATKALEQQPKTGHWICHREHCENLGVMPSGLGAYEWCSNCDCGIDVTEFHMNHYNFCPNCGSYNGGEEE